MRTAPFLRGLTFPPETLKNMGDALVSACETLGLTDRTDQLTEMVARHIVGLAQRGVTTKAAFYLLTVQEFTSSTRAH